MSEHTETSTTQPDAAIEALLFVAAGPVTSQQLAEALEMSLVEVEEQIQSLSIRYIQSGGLRIQRHGGRIQLTTSPELSGVIEKFLGLEVSSRLSRAALETLAIVAYRQPITRPGIDSIRGVSSDGVVKSLLSKGLVQEVGRAEGPGRPILYGITADFMQHFGLSTLEELPPYEKAETQSESENGRLLKD